MAMGEKPFYAHLIRLFYHGLSCNRLLLMIPVQILVGDLHRGPLGSTEVTNIFFPNNSRLKRATAMGVVLLCLSYQDASTDMQHDLLRPTCDLKWPWPEVKYWPDRSRPPCIRFGASCRGEYDAARITPLALLVRRLLAKNRFAKNSYFAVFSPGA